MARDDGLRLDRLLGPGRDEVGCEECFDLLDRYVERAVEHGDADAWMPAMSAHIEGCPACADELETMVALLVDDA